VQARHRQVLTGSEELIGAHGQVRTALDPIGHVFVKGALWRARSDHEGLRVGDAVVVESVDGLTLTVAPAPEMPEGPVEGVQSAT
jgi:membrane-bound serine protease (ClpP class)